MKAMLDCSSLGLEPDGRRCHLIPYGTEVQLIVDWKGLVELAKRSGEVISWKAETVKENDAFDWQNGEISHSVNWRGDRGKLQAVYSIVKLTNGEIDTEVMTLPEVEAIRKRSKASGSGPWVTDFEEMAKKTVIRRHSKRLTLSPEFHDALEKDADKLDPINNRVQVELTTTSNPFEKLTTGETVEAEAEIIAEPEPAAYTSLDAIKSFLAHDKIAVKDALGALATLGISDGKTPFSKLDNETLDHIVSIWQTVKEIIAQLESVKS